MGSKYHYQTWKECHSDGSKAIEGTGIGVFGPGIKHSESLGKTPSIFQAEIHAIRNCAQFNIDKGYRRQRIIIMLDSQETVKALSSDFLKFLNEGAQ